LCLWWLAENCYLPMHLYILMFAFYQPQGCTNPEGPNVRRCSMCNLLHVTPLAHGFLRLCLDFWKVCTPRCKPNVAITEYLSRLDGSTWPCFTMSSSLTKFSHPAAGAGDVYLCKISSTVSGAHSVSYPLYTGSCSLGGKAAGY